MFFDDVEGPYVRIVILTGVERNRMEALVCLLDNRWLYLC